jgi:hypothetical protein
MDALGAPRFGEHSVNAFFTGEKSSEGRVNFEDDSDREISFQFNA